jgi:hypothetical protein
MQVESGFWFLVVGLWFMLTNNHLPPEFVGGAALGEKVPDKRSCPSSFRRGAVMKEDD